MTPEGPKVPAGTPVSATTDATGRFTITFTHGLATVPITIVAAKNGFVLDTPPIQTSTNPRTPVDVVVFMRPAAFPPHCQLPNLRKPTGLNLNSISITDDTDPTGSGEIWISVTVVDLSKDFKVHGDGLLVPFRFTTVSQHFGPLNMSDGATFTFTKGEHVEIPSGPSNDVLITITVRDDDSGFGNHDPFTVNKSSGKEWQHDDLGTASLRLTTTNLFGAIGPGRSGTLAGALFTLRFALGPVSA